MLIVLHGKDSFRIHERIQILQRGFVQKYDQANISSVVWEGKEVAVDTLRSTLLSRSLFSTRRFVVIKSVLTMAEAVIPLFVDALQQMDKDSIVVATTPELPAAKHGLQDVLAKAERVEEFATLNPAQVLQWAKQRFAQAKVTIAPAALTYLVQDAGVDVWKLHQYIQQLIHYHATITLEDVQLFVISPIDDNIFHFTDALAERNSALAIHLLHDQLEAGANPFYLLTMLARQIQILLQVKETQGKGTDLHPYVIKKTLVHANRFSVELLRTIHNQILEIDAQLKTTRLEPELLLDRLVITMTTI